MYRSPAAASESGTSPRLLRSAGILGQHGIPMRTRPAFAQLLSQFGFESRRNGVLQPLGFFVNLVPLHPEDLAQHALDEVMAQCRAVGGLACPPRSAGRCRPRPPPPEPSRFSRFSAIVTAGADTSSQCASVAGIT